MADNATEIAALEALLDTGAGKVTVDGQTVEYHSPAAIRRRLRELKAGDPNYRGRRPRAAGIDLRGW